MEALPTTKFREDSTNLKPKIRKRIQITKKHLEQKYLLCGFAIHAFLAAPVYLYGILIVDSSNTEKLIRIWPAILYQAIGQFSHTFLKKPKSKEKFHGNFQQRQIENRKIILCANVLTCFGITICGYLYSSTWIASKTTTEIIAISIYGLFGGIGSSLILSRAHSIIEIVRPNEDTFVRKTIYLCGEAFCQLFLSFVVTSLRTLYGTALALFLMGAMLLNVIPLSLLITKKHILQVPRSSITQSPITDELRYNSLPGFSKISDNPNECDFDEGIEMQQKNWKSPEEGLYNYMTVIPDESYVAYINPNGVEIMEIIPEEDENISTIRSSCVTMDNGSYMGCERSYNCINTAKSNNSNNDDDDGVDETRRNQRDITKFRKMQKFSQNFSNQIWDIITVKILNPFRRAIIIPEIYPSTFLQSSDIFSYVMCVTVLPDVAICQHQLKSAEIPFLFSLLAFPWMCFAFMTPRFGSTLIKGKFKWHIFGCVSKALGLLFISISSSKLLLSLASIQLGFGQAVTLFLQDIILQNGLTETKWLDIQYPIHSTNGVLIIIWGGAAQFLIQCGYGYQMTVAFSAALYFLSTLTWYILITIRHIFNFN